MAGDPGRDAARRGTRGTPNTRGERTRWRIAEATLSLLIESDMPPNAHDIARRAGVSHRLIFHHYEDLDALHVMVSAVYAEHFGPMVPSVAPDLPFDTRIERTARLRATLYESIGNLGRNTAALAPSHPGLTQRQQATQRILCDLLEQTFAPELDALGRRDRREALAALDAAGSWPLWDRIRRSNGLSVSAARRVVAGLLRAALAVPARGTSR